MAIAGEISPPAKATNDARDDLRHAICVMALAIPLGTMTTEKVDEVMDALDRYVEAKLQPRRY